LNKNDDPYFFSMPSQGKNTQRLRLSITRGSKDDLQTNRKYLFFFFQISLEPFAEVLFGEHHEQQWLNIIFHRKIDRWAYRRRSFDFARDVHPVSATFLVIVEHLGS
jgi:hypothetical protein